MLQQIPHHTCWGVLPIQVDYGIYSVLVPFCSPRDVWYQNEMVLGDQSAVWARFGLFLIFRSRLKRWLKLDGL